MFRFGTALSYNRVMGGWGHFLPKSVAQLTGVLVTGIVAFGTDIEVYYAVPMGVFAGVLAMFFVSMSEANDAYKKRWEKYR